MSGLTQSERAHAHYEEAMRSEDGGQRIVLLKRAVSLDPEFAEAYIELGKSYLDLDEVEEAERALRAAIGLDDNGWAHLYLGHLYYCEEDWDAALKEFHAAKGRLPESSAPLWCIADIHRSAGELEESERYCRAAVAVEPSAAALARLGRLLIEKGERAEGAIYVRRALEVDGRCRVALKCARRYKLRRS
jgi:tetratricopeptide (TPR) repeat protein